MALLRRHPQRVRGIILANTTMAADTPEAATYRERIAAVVESSGDVGVVLAEIVPRLTGATTKRDRPSVRHGDGAMTASVDPLAIAWLQRAMAARPDSTATLRETRIPALVVGGDEDTVTPMPLTEAMAEALHDVRLVRLPAAGHLAAMEDPEGCAAALLDFMTTITRYPGAE